jgi:hypothetical protein
MKKKNRPARLILGHNAFIGVDHLSASRGRQRREKMNGHELALSLLRAARKSGVEGFMTSTHEKMAELLALAHEDATLESLRTYVIVPYAQSHVQRSNERGLIGAAKDAVFRIGFKSMLSLAPNLVAATISRNPGRLVNALIDAELAPFRNSNLDSIIIHNTITDLLLGWNATEILMGALDHIESKYGVRAGLCTFNLALLNERLPQRPQKEPLVLSSFNPLGFQMNPGRESSEAVLQSRRFDHIVMSIFAGGAIPPREAFEYLKSLGAVNSVVFGASTPEHIQETAAALGKLVTDGPPE